MSRDNPFASAPFEEVKVDDGGGAWGGGRRDSGSVPAAFEMQSPPPAWGNAGNGVGLQGGGSSSAGDDREARLNKREEALKKREAAVAAKEAQQGHNNWPRCRPFLRHSIAEDVPEVRRGLVWRNYWAWIFTATGLGWGWLVITMMFIGSHKGLADWLFACLIDGFALPLSFLLWHRQLYKAAISDGAVRWGFFFLAALFQVILAGWIFAAPPVVGKWSAGLITMINEFNRHDGAGIFFGICCIINMVIWGLAGLGGFITWGEAYKDFRQGPATVPDRRSRWLPSGPRIWPFGRRENKPHPAIAALQQGRDVR